MIPIDFEDIRPGSDPDQWQFYSEERKKLFNLENPLLIHLVPCKRITIFKILT